MSEFKRKQTELDSVETILQMDGLSDEQKKSLETIMRHYENITYDNYNHRQSFYNDAVSTMINSFSFDAESLADAMSREHPTLQQNFMRVASSFIKKMASKVYWDDRNKSSVSLAKSMMGNVDEMYLPYI